MLKIEGLISGYGSKKVLNDVSLELRTGEIASIIGHNGAGKSTLFKSIIGLTEKFAGQIELCGRNITKISPSQSRRQGISFVPQGRSTFSGLTILENLEVSGDISATRIARRDDIKSVIKLIPELANSLDKKASTLSGGQRQLLGLAMGMVSKPQLLLLDEPTLGLAPGLAERILGTVKEICGKSGVSAFIIEHRVRQVLAISESTYVLARGSIIFHGPSTDLSHDSNLLAKVYL